MVKTKIQGRTVGKMGEPDLVYASLKNLDIGGEGITDSGRDFQSRNSWNKRSGEMFSP